MRKTLATAKPLTEQELAIRTKRRMLLALFGLFLAWLLVWSSSLDGAFVFDDIGEIVTNGAVHDVGSMAWVRDGRRPVTNLSFAMNWSMSGGSPRAFLAVNIAIHFASAVALFGLVFISARSDRVPEKWRERAVLVASLATLAWLVHPLQTQSVTYIVQRGESMAGMWYLLTLLFAAIGIRREEKGGKSGLLFTLAMIACALGMGSKAVTVTAPLAVVLWDVVFGAGTLAGAVRKRWTLFLSLAITWFVVVWLGIAEQVLTSDMERTVGFGFGGATAWTYLLTQTHVIWHYIGLSFWPARLVIDYAWPFTSDLGGAILPGALLALGFAAGLVGLVRRRWWGFAILFFYVVLAPTSSVIPIADASMEHRMYLPLASIAVLVVVGLLAALDRVAPGRSVPIAVAVMLAASAALGVRTMDRNSDYRSARLLWQSTTDARPDNPRAWNNLGETYLNPSAGQSPDSARALELFERSSTMDPGFATARLNMASAMIDLRRYDEARAIADEILASDGERPVVTANAWVVIGRVRYQASDLRSAADAFETALEIDPDNATATFNLQTVMKYLGTLERARTLASGGKPLEAAREYSEYLKNVRRDVNALVEFAETMVAFGGTTGVVEALERALEIEPDNAKARILLNTANSIVDGRQVYTEQDGENSEEFNPEKSRQWLSLGTRFADTGDFERAEDAYRSSIQFDPTNISSRYSLGLLLQREGYPDEAALEYEELLELAPDRVDARSNLGQCYFAMKEFSLAEQAFREAIEIDPTHFQSRMNLAVLLDSARLYEQAERAYLDALELAPNHPNATKRLRVLRAIMEEETGGTP